MEENYESRSSGRPSSNRSLGSRPYLKIGCEIYCLFCQEHVVSATYRASNFLAITNATNARTNSMRTTALAVHREGTGNHESYGGMRLAAGLMLQQDVVYRTKKIPQQNYPFLFFSRLTVDGRSKYQLRQQGNPQVNQIESYSSLSLTVTPFSMRL